MLEAKGTSGDQEASKQFNIRACEAILKDQIDLYDKFHGQWGPGVLLNKLAGGPSGGSRDSLYMSLDDLDADISVADQAGDTNMAFLKDIKKQVENTNFHQCALIGIVDNTGARVFQIDRDYPAKRIQALMEEFTP